MYNKITFAFNNVCLG